MVHAMEHRPLGALHFSVLGVAPPIYLSVCLFVCCYSLPLEPWIQAVMHAYNSWFPEGFSVEPRFHKSLD